MSKASFPLLYKLCQKELSKERQRQHPAGQIRFSKLWAAGKTAVVISLAKRPYAERKLGMTAYHTIYIVFGSCLPYFHSFPSKSHGPEANVECPHSRCDQKTCRTTSTECNVSCIKTISKADCLWQSSSSVMPETYTGKNVRQLGFENRIETQLLKKTSSTHRMPMEITLRQQLSSLVANFSVPRRNLE